MDLKSPFENVSNLLWVVPQSHEKALKQGLYNALALFMLAVCIAIGWGSYIILEQFFKPLVWALLCGSVLYPFKYSLSKTLHECITHLETTSTPLFVAVLLFPLHIVNNTSENIGNTLLKHLRYLVLGLISIGILLVVYQYTPHVCTCIIWQIGAYGCSVISWIIRHLNIYTIIAIVIVYIISLSTCWHPIMVRHFQVAAYAVWVVISLFIAGFLVPFQLTAFFALQLLLMVGFLYETWLVYEKQTLSGKRISFLEAICIVIQDKQLAVKEAVQRDDSTDELNEADSKFKLQLEKQHEIPDPSMDNSEGVSKQNETLEEEDACKTLTSTKFLYRLLWACCIMLLWINIWILHAVPILLLIYIIKHTGHSFGVWQMILEYTHQAYETTLKWCGERHNALFPLPVTGLFKFSLQINAVVLEIVKNSIDMAASVVVIVLVIVITISTVIFFTVQIYSEGMLVVKIGGNLINNTFMLNPEVQEYIPRAWLDQLNEILDDAYSFGREGVIMLVQQLMKGLDSEKGEQVEKQALELWDRVYQTWMSSSAGNDVMGPTVTTSAVLDSWNDVVEGVRKIHEFNIMSIINFIKENVGMVLSVWESLWSIFKGNVALAMDYCSTAVTIILCGGSAVLNFLVSMIVFFTALFYLLTSSGDVYKPVDLISSASYTGGTRLAVALEDAVACVFKASFKRSFISGLWTWFILNLFQVKIVYLPCVIATLSGAIPFISTYWASFPAVLELYFYHKNAVLAVMLFIVQFVVASVVDNAVLVEMKGGGHPYLTGLSVAGGLFCMGPEGVIFGPLLLCALYTAINMSSIIMNESSSVVEIAQNVKISDTEKQ